MLTDLRAQQAVVCGAHVGTDATEHLKLRLVTVESEQWSALTPPVAAREVLMCQNGCGDGLMDDHALLAESCPDLRHFATFAIAGGPANDASNVLLTVTLASEHADFGQYAPRLAPFGPQPLPAAWPWRRPAQHALQAHSSAFSL